MDFTIKIYYRLLEALQSQNYNFQTFSDFLTSPKEKVVILRHDVDAKKENSLRFAKIQKQFDVKGSYYFRMVPQSYNGDVIREIADLGHEIGYHYEDMDFAVKRKKKKGERKKFSEEELLDTAFEIFSKNLEILRKLYPVKTICMHGSPLSKFDNKALWKKYNYRDHGIIGEPYFDIDFNNVFYITDTGRRWDGDKVSVRDKVSSNFNLSFHSTAEIIENVQSLPDQIMMTFHPQRWNDNFVQWTKEIVFQNLKNQVKKLYIRKS